MTNAIVVETAQALPLFTARTGTASLAVVLPTLQEAATIDAVIHRAVAALDDMGIPYELIVVDDASQDGTAQIVHRLRSVLPQLFLVQRVAERGLSGAILDGWANTSADVLAVMDADLQHPPELLPRLWAAIEDGADLAVASRYALGATAGRWRWLRRTISSCAVLLCRPLQNGPRHVDDPLSGFFLVRRDVLREVPSLQRSGFKLLVEILVRAPLRRVDEVPFCFGERQGGVSKASAWVLWDYLWLLLRLYAGRARAFSIMASKSRQL